MSRRSSSSSRSRAGSKQETSRSTSAATSRSGDSSGAQVEGLDFLAVPGSRAVSRQQRSATTVAPARRGSGLDSLTTPVRRASESMRRGSQTASPGNRKRSSVTPIKQTPSTLAFDAEARQIAISKICKELHHVDCLTSIDRFIADFEAQKNQVQGKLATALRLQADETKLGLSLLSQCQTNVRQLREGFHSINNLATSVKNLFNQNELKRVHTALNNMEATTRLLDNLGSIKERAAMLLDELDRDGGAAEIKSSYQKMRNLIRLRNSAYEQGSTFSVGFKRKLQESFKVLNGVAKAVEERVWENISDAYILALDEPTTLIRTVEVIVMEDKAKVIKVFDGLEENQKRKRSMKEKMDEVLREGVGEKFERMLRSAEDVIAEKFPTRDDAKKTKDKDKKKGKRKKTKQTPSMDGTGSPFSDEEDDYSDNSGFSDEDDGDESEESEEEDEDTITEEEKQRQEDVSKLKMEFVQKTISKLKMLVRDCREVCESLAPMFPAEFHVVETLELEYRQWFKKCINFHTMSPNDLTPGEQLAFVAFIQWYKQELRHFKNPPKRGGRIKSALSPRHNVHLSALLSKGLGGEAESFDSNTHELMRAFVKATTARITKLVDNTLKVEKSAEPYVDPEGCYVTNGPSDLFYTVNSVLDAFQIKGKAIEHVVIMLAQLFQRVQNHQSKYFSEIEAKEEATDGKEKEGADVGDTLSKVGFAKEVDHEDTYFCAQINNLFQCQENVDKIMDEMIESLYEAEEDDLNEVNKRVTDLLEETEDGFAYVAQECADILVQRVRRSTKEAGLDKFFKKEWLESSSLVEDILDSMQEQFSSYNEWISRESYVERIIKLCLRNLTEDYVRAFLDVKPEANSKDSEQLVGRLIEDHEAFKQFYGQFTDIVKKDIIDKELEQIGLISEVLTETDLNFISVYFIKMAERFEAEASGMFRSLLECHPQLKGDKTRLKEVIMAALEDSLPEEIKESIRNAQRMEMEAKNLEADAGEGADTGNGAKDKMIKAREKGRKFWQRFKDKSKALAANIATSKQKGEIDQDDDEIQLDIADFLA